MILQLPIATGNGAMEAKQGWNESIVLVIGGNEEQQATESSRLHRICERFFGTFLGATGSNELSSAK